MTSTVKHQTRGAAPRVRLSYNFFCWFKAPGSAARYGWPGSSVPSNSNTGLGTSFPDPPDDSGRDQPEVAYDG
ncbi:hypothetical protein GCM10022206_38210 [Streptomyces chiangmaiensis]